FASKSLHRSYAVTASILEDLLHVHKFCSAITTSTLVNVDVAWYLQNVAFSNVHTNQEYFDMSHQIADIWGNIKDTLNSTNRCELITEAQAFCHECLFRCFAWRFVLRLHQSLITLAKREPNLASEAINMGWSTQ